VRISSTDVRERCRPAVRAVLAAAGVVLVAGCAAGTPARAGTAESSSPADSTGPIDPEVSSVHPVTTVIVTDDPALTATGTAEESWPDLLADMLADAGSPLDVTTAAVDGAGFAQGEPSFTELVYGSVVHPTQLVIFFDSRIDSAAAPDIALGASDAFSAVEEQAPDAEAVVVEPWGDGAGATARGEDVRGALREGGQGAEVVLHYVDPVAEGWPVGADQQQIADLLYQHVAPLAEIMARSGSFD
jgi:hypothetical protein